jgi:hypothetical protein
MVAGIVNALLLILTMLRSDASAEEPRNANAGVHFVGSISCAACHREIYNSFKKTGMGQSFGGIKPDLIAALPGSATINASSPGHSYRVYSNNGRLYQSESVLLQDGQRISGAPFAAEYIVGSGVNGYTFLFRRDNRLFEAPISYYSRTRTWDLSPGFDAYDAGFARPARVACLECHIGRFGPGVQSDGSFPKQPFAEEAIGCESCHGPGELHATERGAGKAPSSPDDSIVNPAALSQEPANAICIRCHQGNDARVLYPGKSFADFRPGTSLSGTLSILKVPLRRDQAVNDSDLLEHGFAMTLSKCFRNSRSMTCAGCHSVHRNIEPAERVAYYRSRCLTCHEDTDCKLSNSKRKENDCTSCHMPKRPVAIIAHTALTNHRIIRTVDEAYPESAYTDTAEESTGLIRVSGATGPDRKPVPDLVLLQAYRALLTKAPWLRAPYEALLDRLRSAQPDNSIVQSAAGHELVIAESINASGNAIPLLQKTLEGGVFDSEVCLDLAEALVKQHRLDDAAGVLKQGVAREPFEPKLRKMLISVTMDAGRYSESKRAMTDYLRIYPADTRMRTLVNEVGDMTGVK